MPHKAYGSTHFFAESTMDMSSGFARGLGPFVGGFGMPGAFGSFPHLPGAPFGPGSQLHLALPARTVRERLVPDGHMAEIAQGCRVQIDLHEEVPPDKLRVVLSGSVTANSLAALALQWRIWFAEGGC
mmetsp:Transcript_66203/g.191874  ORF Transcript_66203/g.191874 Transcript_66203/m.191874 type:complete len:128 (-) Transcript_66203:23-406(-)